MKLIVDMNLSPRWVDALAERDISAVHWSAIGAATASDTTIMRTAREQEAMILTHDLDFGAILAVSGDDAPSVIQLRLGAVTPERAAAAVVAALSQFATELAAGALLTVDAKRSRVSLLPLAR